MTSSPPLQNPDSGLATQLCFELQRIIDDDFERAGKEDHNKQ